MLPTVDAETVKDIIKFVDVRMKCLNPRDCTDADKDPTTIGIFPSLHGDFKFEPAILCFGASCFYCLLSARFSP